MKSIRALAILVSATALLAGCGNAKKELGLERTAPDEFAVVKRAPLEMPPEFFLRPPEPGAPRPQEQATADQARDAVLGTTDGDAPKIATNGEVALLQEADATNYPNIRKVVDAEAKVTTKKNVPVVKKLLNIGKKDSGPAKIVNPAEESKRLKTNAEQGKPVTAGETPSIED